MISTALFAASWPAFRRDMARDGYVQEEAAPPLTQRWTYDIPGRVISSPVVAYGRVYIGARDSRVYCFDAYTGALDWTFTTGDWVDATPVISTGTVFVSGRDGNLYALNAFTGALVWKYSTGSRDVSSPMVLGGEVYGVTGNPNRQLYVLDAKTGGFRRGASLSQFAASAPVIDPAGGYIYLGTTNGQYASWNLNMLPQWGPKVQTRGSIGYATPALSNGRLLAAPGDDDWSAHAYDPASGSEVWVSTFLSNSASLASSIAASSTTLYVGAGYGGVDQGLNSGAVSRPETLWALDLMTGAVKWSLALGTASAYGIASSPALANDYVYIMSPQGELIAAAASGGTAVYRLALNGPSVTSPAVANGWVYTATLSGRVYGFQSQRAWAVSGPDPILDDTEGILTVSGTVVSPQLQNYILEYSSGTNPLQWTFLSSGTANVSNAFLATWDTRNLFNGLYTLRLSVRETGVSGDSPQAFYTYSIPQIKTASVSPSSGTVLALADGTEVDIPAGAVSVSDILGIKALNAGDYPDSGVPTTADPSTVVRIVQLASNPHPQFGKDVTIKLPYYTIPPRNEANMRIYYYDDNSGLWSLVNTSTVKPREKRVWAAVNHFTMFRVMEYMPSGALLQSAQVYTYPNPARGATVTFKYLVGDTSDVMIKVFDVSGSLVAVLNQSGAPAGIASILNWDVSGKATGVYIYRLEASSVNGAKDSVIKKLAIIH